MNRVEIEGSLIGKAHDLVRSAVNPGETAVDATVGNGHDTLFLAHCVRTGGKVIGFDVQEQAIKATRKRLIHDGIPKETVELYAVGHEKMHSYVPSGVSVVMFNLGYLPGSDKATITLTRTTLEALGHALDCLKLGGRLSVMCYPGHTGGDSEADAVVRFLAAEVHKGMEVTQFSRVGAGERSPFLLMVEKRSVV